MPKESLPSGVATVGDTVAKVEVAIGPRFLELFSEHLYSSPNKAFEELVSNSWDAGAGTVYIGVGEDLLAPRACIWVLDDGESMDLDGLQLLWSVATSHKRTIGTRHGRHPIGKFGIGKLATYLLADEVTYVCRASDGVIRAVTMDYRRITAEDSDRLHREPIMLDVRELRHGEVPVLLERVSEAQQILSLIRQGVPKPQPQTEWEDEFGGPDASLPTNTNTWTLALLTSLKPACNDMQLGRIRWLLRTALPLGSSISVVFNGEALAPSKVGVPVAKEWVLGEGLGISSVALAGDEPRKVQERCSPYPHVRIQGIPGRVTGRVRLYQERISGGKSDLVGASNGFYVNIRGRVVNSADTSFKLENLNHSAWSKFRATIRADGLDEQLAINREGLLDGSEHDVFEAFLRALFNKARSAHDAAAEAAWPQVGEVLTQSWGAVALEPLGRVVAEGLTNPTGLPSFVDASAVGDPHAMLQQWHATLASQPGDLIRSVILDALLPDDPLVRYRLSTRTVVVNRSHPFTREHGETHEEQELLRDVALADVLTQAFMADAGVHDDLVRRVWAYRDQTLRLLAQVRRRTAAQLAEMLVKATSNARGFETIVGDALECLGFVVERLGRKGEPEGIATAPSTPADGDTAASYSFTYDAKSTGNARVKTKDVSIAGLARHRRKYSAQHTLVVAPDYEMGALQEECAANDVTPMRAADLASLLMLAAAKGPISFGEFSRVFDSHDPDAVCQWIAALAAQLRPPALSLGVFLAALAEIGYSGPDTITASVIADRIRQMPGGQYKPTRKDVTHLVYGLAILVPNLIRISDENITLAATPRKLREAILHQIRSIPPSYRYGMGAELEGAGAHGDT